MLDRVRMGHVTDLVDVGTWPIFNVADASIVVGLALLAWIFWSRGGPRLKDTGAGGADTREGIPNGLSDAPMGTPSASGTFLRPTKEEDSVQSTAIADSVSEGETLGTLPDDSEEGEGPPTGGKRPGRRVAMAVSQSTTAREFTAEANWLRLDLFLAARATGFSRSQLHRLVTDGSVLVNGCLAKPSQRVWRGDRVFVSVPPPRKLNLVPQSMPLTVVFQDAHIVVIDKPAGLSVHPGPGHPDRTLVNALLAL